MKKIISTLFLLALSSAVFATPDPKVILQTAALGYPYTQPFTVNVTFSEPVTGFDSADINVVNATITNVTGGNADFVLTVVPRIPGSMTIFIPANIVRSLTTGSFNLASNKLNITALDPTLNPSSNFDLSPWTLTLPLALGDIGNAITISNSTLVGHPSLNSGYINPPYFYTDNVSGSMNFFAPLNGATTPGSVFPRCELSEQLPTSPGTWGLNTYTSNLLSASLLVTQVPPSKKIVIGAIQDKGTTDSSGQLVAVKSLVKIYYDLNPLDPNGNACNGCIYARIRPVPAQEVYLKTITLVNNTPLNKLFMYRISLLNDGTLTVKANNVSITYNLNTSTDNTVGWGTQQLLFKAGVYILDNGSSDSQGGAANFYSLAVKHTGCPTVPV